MDAQETATNPTNPVNQETVTNAINFILNVRRDMVVYHNQKENFAYIATAAYLGAIATVLFADHSSYNLLQATFAYAVASILLIFVLSFVAWQLTKRWEANTMVDICTTLATKWLTEPPHSVNLKSTKFKGAYFPEAFRALSDTYPLEHDFIKLRSIGTNGYFQLAAIFVGWFLLGVKLYFVR